MSDPIFVGIDVSSQTWRWRSDQSESQQFSNDGAGIDALEQQSGSCQWFASAEATGGYEFEAAYTLQASGLAVRYRPAWRATWRAMGGQNRRPDARMLTGFAQVLHQHPQRDRFIKPLADAQLQQLQALVLRRRQIVQMLTAERHRLRLARGRPSQHSEAHCLLEGRTGRLRWPGQPPRTATSLGTAPRRRRRRIHRACRTACPALARRREDRRGGLRRSLLACVLVPILVRALAGIARRRRPRGAPGLPYIEQRDEEQEHREAQPQAA